MANEHDSVMDEIQQLSRAQALAESIPGRNAKYMYSIYRAYVKAGFVESQAFELTKITLKGYVMHLALDEGYED